MQPRSRRRHPDTLYRVVIRRRSRSWLNVLPGRPLGTRRSAPDPLPPLAGEPAISRLVVSSHVRFPHVVPGTLHPAPAQGQLIWPDPGFRPLVPYPLINPVSAATAQTELARSGIWAPAISRIARCRSGDFDAPVHRCSVGALHRPSPSESHTPTALDPHGCRGHQISPARVSIIWPE